jgi:ribosomal protein S18 acetylase RimI-like enzyme
MPNKESRDIHIRRATVDDAASICKVWEAIVEVKAYSAIDRPFTLNEERSYIQSLSDREGIFLAETAEHQIVGFQTIDLWARHIRSMDHIAQLGTFILREWRGRGLGGQLAANTFTFARSAAYEKLVIFVRASNTGAQGFYKRLGFTACGRLARQVKIASEYDDEILMEMSL